MRSVTSGPAKKRRRDSDPELDLHARLTRASSRSTTGRQGGFQTFAADEQRLIKAGKTGRSDSSRSVELSALLQVGSEAADHSIQNGERQQSPALLSVLVVKCCAMINDRSGEAATRRLNARRSPALGRVRRCCHRLLQAVAATARGWCHGGRAAINRAYGHHLDAERCIKVKNAQETHFARLASLNEV